MCQPPQKLPTPGPDVTHNRRGVFNTSLRCSSSQFHQDLHCKTSAEKQAGHHNPPLDRPVRSALADNLPECLMSGLFGPTQGDLRGGQKLWWTKAGPPRKSVGPRLKQSVRRAAHICETMRRGGLVRIHDPRFPSPSSPPPTCCCGWLRGNGRPGTARSFVPGGGPGGNSRSAHGGSSTGTPHS